LQNSDCKLQIDKLQFNLNFNLKSAISNQQSAIGFFWRR